MTPERLRTMRIGVLMGGTSSEREVSLRTGEAVTRALRERGYRPVVLDIGEDAVSQIREARIEVAFLALHGRFGEDGMIQALLECLRIPYTGSGVLASALGMDKLRSRWIFQHGGLPVPPYWAVTPESAPGFAICPDGPSLPLIVKPAGEGSSVGISIVHDIHELPSAFETAFKYGSPVLVEQYIPGREITVGILDREPLGAIEIRPREGFYDYQTKYTEGLAEHLFPAPLPPDLYGRALELGLTAHRLLGCEGGTRVDLILSDAGDFCVLEVNTLPGMTPMSLLPEIAAGAGIPFPELCERLLLGARLKG